MTSMRASNLILRYFHIEMVADGVYAAIAVPDTGAVANAAIVNLGDSTLIFDTFNTQQASAELREAAERLTGLPIGYVVNSHWHGDHIRGNQTFRDVPIIASVKTRNEMEKIHPERFERQRSQLPKTIESLNEMKIKLQHNEVEDRENVEKDVSFLTEFTLSLETLKLVLPTITFDEHHTIKGSKRTVELMTFGGGHTLCDAFLYLREDKVILLGDLVGSNNHIMLADGNPIEWMEILKKVKELDFDTVVCGHGPVGTADIVDENLQYLTDLLSISEAFLSSGQEADALNNLDMPDHYQNWQAGYLFHRNIQFLHDLSKGKRG